MDLVNTKGKKNKFVKALKRLWSLRNNINNSSNTNTAESKCSCSGSSTSTSTALHHHKGKKKKKKKKKKHRKELATPPPEGWFSVYVGAQKQRFNIKTEFANHPLFRTLLEEAETEYGFITQGPIHLPCDVHHFCKVMAEMDSEQLETATPVCSPLRTLCSPSPPRRSYRTDQPHALGSSYKLLKQSRWLKFNTTF